MGTQTIYNYENCLQLKLGKLTENTNNLKRQTLNEKYFKNLK